MCELIGRVDADPDVLPRTENFGLDYIAFSAMCPTCPPDFLKLTYNCVKVSTNTVMVRYFRCKFLIWGCRGQNRTVFGQRQRADFYHFKTQKIGHFAEKLCRKYSSNELCNRK